MKNLNHKRDEPIEIRGNGAEKDGKQGIPKGKLRLKSVLGFAFGLTVFRCTSSFFGGLLLAALFLASEALSTLILLDEISNGEI